MVAQTLQHIRDELVGGGAKNEEEVGVEREDGDEGGAVLEGEASFHGLCG